MRIDKTESGDPIPAKKAVRRYPKGREVTVYYHPKNPTESVLEPGFQGIPVEVVMLLCGSVGFFYFAWMAVVVVRYGWLSD